LVDPNFHGVPSLPALPPRSTRKMLRCPPPAPAAMFVAAEEYAA